MKAKRSTVIPMMLFVYLAVMAALGYNGFANNTTSAGQYFGTIGATLLVIVLLHFNIKRRDRMHNERKERLNALNGTDVD